MQIEDINDFGQTLSLAVLRKGDSKVLKFSSEGRTITKKYELERRGKKR